MRIVLDFGPHRSIHKKVIQVLMHKTRGRHWVQNGVEVL